MPIKIYHVILEDDDVGECEGFYAEDEKLITQWSLNDAHWRGEYMESLLEYLGAVVKEGDKKLHTKFKKEMMELYGY